MRVEVNDADRTVFPVDGAKQRKSDCMVATKRDDTRERLALLRRTLGLRIGLWCTRKDAVVAVLDLLDGIGIVVPMEHCQLLDPCVISSRCRLQGPKQNKACKLHADCP
jgi:hypothetical protein